MVEICKKCGYLKYSLHKKRKIFCKCESEEIEKLIQDKLDKIKQ